jgi:CRP-like cAMP-binding protein
MNANHLLRALPAADYARLEPLLHEVELKHHDVLIEADEPFDYVYFPETCMISIVTLLDNGDIIEAATVGREGVVGLPLFLGLATVNTTAICQMSGRAQRMSTPDFRHAIQSVPVLHKALGLYTNALIAMLGQGGACNSSHTVEQRLARWLLTISDRVGQDRLAITQEFLSQMLGVQRPSVTIAVGVLEDAGMVVTQRGNIEIVDRERLTAAACECYDIIRRLYEETWKQTSASH